MLLCSACCCAVHVVVIDFTIPNLVALGISQSPFIMNVVVVCMLLCCARCCVVPVVVLCLLLCYECCAVHGVVLCMSLCCVH